MKNIWNSGISIDLGLSYLSNFKKHCNPFLSCVPNNSEKLAFQHWVFLVTLLAHLGPRQKKESQSRKKKTLILSFVEYSPTSINTWATFPFLRLCVPSVLIWVFASWQTLCWLHVSHGILFVTTNFEEGIAVPDLQMSKLRHRRAEWFLHESCSQVNPELSSLPLLQRGPPLSDICGHRFC